MEDGYARCVLDRIRSKTALVGSCLEWQGCLTSFGYGQMVLKVSSGVYRTVTAHRAHWMAYHGVDLESSVQVCHRCDNPRCVNIDHLFLGTAKDNSDDKWSKGRGISGRKLRYHTRERKISNEVIAQVRLETGRNCEIARKYGISSSYVSEIRSGKSKRLICPEGAMIYSHGVPVAPLERKVEEKKRVRFSPEVIQMVMDEKGDWRRKAFELGMSESYAYRLRRKR